MVKPSLYFPRTSFHRFIYSPATTTQPTMQSLPPPPVTSQLTPQMTNNNAVHNMLSYDSNIMLAAIISLLLVILFVLLLHIYAKWFLVQAARQGSRRAVSVGPRFHHFQTTFGVETFTTFGSSPTKGLEPEDISSIPLFLYKRELNHTHGLMECVICLSLFENGEMGRKLTKCSHVFHVQCIDMWLCSHTTCPICRAPVVCDVSKELPGDGRDQEFMSETRLEILVQVPSLDNDQDVVRTNDSPSSSSLGASLKRIMSRGRCEHKVRPSENCPESNVSEREGDEEVPSKLSICTSCTVSS